MDGMINKDLTNKTMGIVKVGFVRNLWTFSLFVFIVCNIAFSSKTYLMMLNSYALYFFLGVSLICVIVSGEIKANLFLIAMLGFQVVMLIGNIYGTSTEMFSTTYNFFITLCIVFFIINYIQTDRDIKFIFTSIMFGGLLLDIYILSIYGSGFIGAITSHTRVGEVVGNANDVGLKSCFSAIIALYFVIKDKHKKSKKVIYLMLCVVCLFFALITASKQVAIILVVGMLYLVFTSKNKFLLSHRKNIFFIIVAFTVAVYFFYNAKYFDYLRLRLDEFLELILNGGGSHSDEKRMRFITEGIAVFWQNPFFGEGTASSYNYFSTYSHSNFVELLMNHGIFGFLVYYFVFPVAVFGCIKKKNKGQDKLNISSLCIFIFIAVFVLSFTLVYYSAIYYQVLIAVAATFGLKTPDTGYINTNNR